ncbi:transglutaminase-like domain-containing protein [Microbacterium sp. BWT-B31]|uniref:transglutaminase-like domain-containing protein n=1 Tax=Microbacterium sp. BWT-B31 TaxID=3232072 RepID=UPI003527E5A6
MSAAKASARRWCLDLGASALLLAVPIVGFWPTYATAGYLVAAVGGLLVGAAIAAVAAWQRWGILILAGLTVLAYLLLGPALAVSDSTIARVVPTLESWRLLAVGAVDSWKQLLTTVAPVPAGEGFLIVPFLLALVASVLTVSLALRAPVPAWALVPATGFLAAQIALGTSDPALPVAEGVVFAVAAIGWLAIRQAWAPQGDAVSLGERGASGGRGRRLVLGSGVVAVAVIVGVVLSGFAAPAGPRYVLRDVVIPPFDVREYASPLQSFRSLVRDSRDETLFTVSGMPEGSRVRLAAMDAYSGTVYNVSDMGAGSSSAFTPVRGEMSPDALGTPAQVRVEIGELSGVWMPGVGAIEDVTFDGDRAEALRRSAYYNPSTGTGVVVSRLKSGDAYDLHVVVPTMPTDDALADAEFAPVKIPAQEGVPEGIAEMASDAVAEATTPIEQVRALQTMLSTTGFFSHGLEGEPPSRAGHGAERIASMLGAKQMVGDDEQYAVAMALLADSIGIPSRVVLGFYPDPDAAPAPVFDATGENVHAWVEVAFDGFGWVAFDPTPPEDQIPSDQTTKPKADPKPQVLQPPPPQEEPVDLPPTIPDEREDDDKDGAEGADLALIVGIASGSIGILLVLAAPFVVIGALKAGRRRRRRAAERPSDRISGGWDELVDRASDLGTPVRPGATRLEDAAVVSTAFAEPAVATLAVRADAEVFGPAEPDEADIAEFWRQVDEMVGTMSSRSSFWRRLGARLSLRSLLADTRFALPAKTPRAPKPVREPKPAAEASSSPVDNPENA